MGKKTVTIHSEIFSAQGYVIRHVSGAMSLQDVQAAWSGLLEDGVHYP